MIRPAEEKDAAAIARLVFIILKDMELPFLNEVPEAEVLAILAETALEPTYRYGLSRGIVEEIDGEVAGIAFGYPADDEPLIDLPLSAVLVRHNLSGDLKLFEDLETLPGEWYLDSIAVAEKFRGQKVGTRLLAAIPAIAQAAGFAKVGLNVE